MKEAYLFNGQIYLYKMMVLEAVHKDARSMGLFLEKAGGEEGPHGIWFNYVQLDGSQGFKKDGSFADAIVMKYPVVE